MLKHIIMWDHLDGLSPEEKTQNAALVKATLEKLVGIIPGLLELQVYTELVKESSNAEVVLYSVFASPEALLVYQDHPAHVQAATEVVRPRMTNRRCADFLV